MTLRKCGRRDEAEDALSKALELDPAYARTHPAVERVSRSGRTEVGQRTLEWKAVFGVVGLALLLAMVLIVGVHGCLSSSQEPPPDQAALDAAVGQRVQAFGKVTQGMSYSEVASLWGSPSGTYSENDNRIAGPGEAGGPGKYECTWYRDPNGSDGDLTGAIVRFSNGVVTGILPTGDWAVHK